MGNDQTARIAKPLQKFDIEIVCEKISRHLQLQRERKINELATKERELAEKVKAKRRGYEDTLIDIGILVNLLKYITASKIVIRYSQLIKEHSMLVAEACKTNNFTSIRELSPYFEGIVWSTNKLNLSYIHEFNALIANHFRPTDVQEIMKMNKVDKELKDCFDTIEPTPAEIQKYLIEFLKRHNITDFKFPRGMEPTPTYGQGGNYPPFGPGGPYAPYPPGPNNYYPPNQGFGPQPPQYTVPGVVPINNVPQQPILNPHPSFGIIDPQAFANPNAQQTPSNPQNIDSINDDDIEAMIKGLNFGNPTPNTAPAPGFNDPNISLPPNPTIPNLIPSPVFVPGQNPGQAPSPTFAEPPRLVDNTQIPHNVMPPQQMPKGPAPKVKTWATGPEAYTDDKDDNCELGNFEPLILSMRINQMRQGKV